MSTIKSDNSDLTINASGTSKDIKFQADGTERMVLKSDGKLGVGTASPSAPLHVNGNSYLIAGSHGIEGNADPTNYLINTTSGILDIKWFGGVRFLTNGSTERMRVTSNGLCFNGDTSANNALDDYEEGTWTPVPTNCTGTASDTNYTKIGDTVHIWGRINFTGASGEIQIYGLPYAPANNQVGGSIMLTGANIGGGSTYNVIVYFNSTSRILIYTSEDNSSWNTLSNSHIGNGDQIIFNGFYKV
jgi:hypothetical protein